MDAGITIRPVSGIVAADYARPASVPLQQAVSTELDPSQAVTATRNVAPLRLDAVSAQNAQDTQTRVNLIDPATRDVILRVIDTRTHQVIRQIPEQALLRMRAYARALDRGESSAKAWRKANIAV